MKADYIKIIVDGISDLPYKTILFDGTWGIGKSYAVKEALEGVNNVCKISMFGLNDASQIYHEVLFQLALKNSFLQTILHHMMEVGKLSLLFVPLGGGMEIKMK